MKNHCKKALSAWSLLTVAGLVVACGVDETDDASLGTSAGAVAASERDERDAAGEDRDKAGEDHDDASAGGRPVDDRGEYRGYICDSGLFIVTEGITRAEAFENCVLNAAANPGRGFLCTWNDEIIHENDQAMVYGCPAVDDAAAPADDFAAEGEPGADGRDGDASDGGQSLCGLFRGGRSESEHMIASPNPPESVSDTDGACLEYCWASGMQPGDLCARGGEILAIHNLLPGDTACWRACAAASYPGVLECLAAGNDGDLCQERLNLEVAECGGGCYEGG